LTKKLVGVADPPAPASPASLAALVALGAGTALWSLVLWGELVLARAGGRPFCPLGGEGDCARLWDAAFASAVHRVTGLPVAAWGVAWGLAAFALPLVALWRRAEGRPAPQLLTATRVVSAAGVLGVCVAAAAAAAERVFCGGCMVVYVLVAGHAGIALFGWPSVGWPDLKGGVAWSGGALLLALGALLYPGVHTPRSSAEASRSALAAATAASPAASTPAAGGTGPLGEMIASLTPAQKQGLSDSLHVYRTSTPETLPPPRALSGAAGAPVRITEFTDVLCTHCAELHETLGLLRQHLPADSFSVDSRHFPLDGDCNPLVTARRGDPVRCLGAKVRICLEGNPGAEQAAGRLFANQRSLTAERLLELATPGAPRSLDACLARPETAARLKEDVELARRWNPDGTPLVIVNGRRGTSFGPFLYAMVVTGGSPDHPAFAALPPPNPQAHVH
jgi:protein-disulfide isomerase